MTEFIDLEQKELYNGISGDLKLFGEKYNASNDETLRQIEYV